MRDSTLLTVAAFLACIGVAIAYIRISNENTKLRAENYCLQHPELWNSGASSAVATMYGGKVVTRYNGRTVTCK